MAMEVRPEPIHASRRLPLQALIAVVILALAAVAVGASLVRPGALAPAPLAAAGASAAPADPSASPDASGKPDKASHSRGFGFGFGFGRGFGAGPSTQGRTGGVLGRGNFLGAIKITAIDGASVSLESASGWMRTIDTSGITITRAGAAIKVGDLRVGDKVVLDETRNKDGSSTLKGLSVALEQRGGTISKLGSGSITLQQGKGTATVTTTSDTVYRRDGNAISRDDLAAGQRVTAVGTADADGNLTAEAVDVQPDVVMGTVTKVDGTTLTISTPGGGTATVKLTGKTTIKVAGTDTATASDIAVKSMVVAQGVKGSDGVLTADSVRAGSWRPAATNGNRGWQGGRGNASPSASPSN
jgi:hypothetical protein